MKKEQLAFLALVLGSISAGFTMLTIGHSKTRLEPPTKRTTSPSRPKAESERAILTYAIAEGYRAFRIPALKAVGSAALVKMGDRVDVIGVFAHANSVSFTRVLAQNVRVLQAERPAEAKEPKEQSPAPEQELVLEITPLQAQQLLNAHALGKLVVTLRGPNDGWMVSSTSAQMQSTDAPQSTQERPSPARTQLAAPRISVSAQAGPMAPTQIVTVVRGSQKEREEVSE